MIKNVLHTFCLNIHSTIMSQTMIFGENNTLKIIEMLPHKIKCSMMLLQFLLYRGVEELFVYPVMINEMI